MRNMNKVSDEVLSIPDSICSGGAYTSSKRIAAIRLVAFDAHRGKFGDIRQLPPGARLDSCGNGYNDRTVKVYCDGHFYFVFREDHRDLIRFELATIIGPVPSTLFAPVCPAIMLPFTGRAQSSSLPESGLIGRALRPCKAVTLRGYKRARTSELARTSIGRRNPCNESRMRTAENRVTGI